MKIDNRFLAAPLAAALTLVLLAAPAAADQCILDDLIVDGSACIGFDCVCNSEVFGFDTLRLKENNLRITFIDTSSAASFPRGDWQIRANESTNGGANEFAVDWLGTGAANGSSVVSTPFNIEGDAPNNAIYVDDAGRVGFKTSVPSVELHVRDGNSPTLRLEQDGSAGFTPQTWDVAGNETNFFVRDVTFGSALPLRIRPGSPSNSIMITQPNGDIGMGTSSPGDELHVRRTGADDVIAVMESTQAQNTGFSYVNNQATWTIFNNATGQLRFNVAGLGTVMQIDDGTGDVTLNVGDLTIPAGNCSDQAGGGGCTPDYVFEPDYELPSLAELGVFIAENKHLPNVPSAADNAKHGINMRRLNFAMLEKIEELVLYTLEQQEEIDRLTARLEKLEQP